MAARIFADADVLLLENSGAHLPIVSLGAQGAVKAPEMAWGLNGAVQHLVNLAAHCACLSDAGRNIFFFDDGAKDVPVAFAAIRVCRAALNVLEEELRDGIKGQIASFRSEADEYEKNLKDALCGEADA